MKHNLCMEGADLSIICIHKSWFIHRSCSTVSMNGAARRKDSHSQAVLMRGCDSPQVLLNPAAKQMRYITNSHCCFSQSPLQYPHIWRTLCPILEHWGVGIFVSFVLLSVSPLGKFPISNSSSDSCFWWRNILSQEWKFSNQWINASENCRKEDVPLIWRDLLLLPAVSATGS